MSNTLQKIAFGFLFSFLSLPLSPASASLEVQDVLQGIRDRGEFLRDVDLTFRSASYGENGETGQKADDHLEGLPLVIRSEWRLRRSGQQLRVDRQNSPTPGPYQEHFAWDGQVHTSYGFLRGESDPRGFIEPRRGPIFHLGFWATPIEHEVLDFREPLWTVVDKGTWTLEGRERVGLWDTIRVESQDVNGFRASLWVVPTHSFVPVRMRVTIPVPIPLGEEGNRDILEEMEVQEIVEVDGVWVVKRAQIRLLNPNFTPHLKNVHAFELLSCKRNVDHSQTSFRLQFPTGTRLWDGILQIGHIVGERVILRDGSKVSGIMPYTDVEGALADEAPRGQVPREADGAAPVHLASTQQTEPSIVSRWWPLVMAGAVIACVILSRMYGRRTRQTP